MPDEIYKTTRADFERYKKETKYWVERFGLTDIEMFVEHDQIDEEARAVAIVQLEAKIARSILQQVWTSKPSDGEIERVAFHEFMEVLLSPLWVLATRRHITEDELESARHGIIRRFENCLWKENFRRRKKK